MVERKGEQEKIESACWGTCHYNMFPMFRRNSGSQAFQPHRPLPTSRCYDAMHYGHSTFCDRSRYLAHAVGDLGLVSQGGASWRGFCAVVDLVRAWPTSTTVIVKTGTSKPGTTCLSCFSWATPGGELHPANGLEPVTQMSGKYHLAVRYSPPPHCHSR